MRIRIYSESANSLWNDYDMSMRQAAPIREFKTYCLLFFPLGNRKLSVYHTSLGNSCSYLNYHFHNDYLRNDTSCTMCFMWLRQSNVQDNTIFSFTFKNIFVTVDDFNYICNTHTQHILSKFFLTKSFIAFIHYLLPKSFHSYVCIFLLYIFFASLYYFFINCR